MNQANYFRRSARVLITLSALMSSAISMLMADDDELTREASWRQKSSDQIRMQCRNWLDAADVSSQLQDKVESVINRDDLLDSSERLEIVVGLIAEIFVESRDLVDACGQKWTGDDLPIGILDSVTIPETAILQLRLLAGRWFAQNEMYDEAIKQFNMVTTDDVCDPVTLLFYHGFCCQRLRQKEECLRILNRLNENRDSLPRRYAALSRLMMLDMEPLKEDSLDEVARMMDDIRRRQALYRSGTRVRDLEKKVVEKLDKMIEELEKQQQKSSASSPPSSPMQDSQRAGGSGSGAVKQKTQSDGGQWGNLPPKKRAAALADMTKDLPPHFREVIEEYFRQLARESEKE